MEDTCQWLCQWAIKIQVVDTGWCRRTRVTQWWPTWICLVEGHLAHKLEHWVEFHHHWEEHSDQCQHFLWRRQPTYLLAQAWILIRQMRISLMHSGLTSALKTWWQLRRSKRFAVPSIDSFSWHSLRQNRSRGHHGAFPQGGPHPPQGFLESINWYHSLPIIDILLRCIIFCFPASSPYLMDNLLILTQSRALSFRFPLLWALHWTSHFPIAPPRSSSRCSTCLDILGSTLFLLVIHSFSIIDDIINKFLARCRYVYEARSPEASDSISLTLNVLS